MAVQFDQGTFFQVGTGTGISMSGVAEQDMQGLALGDAIDLFSEAIVSGNCSFDAATKFQPYEFITSQIAGILDPPVITPPSQDGVTFPFSVFVTNPDPQEDEIIIYTDDGSIPDWGNGTQFLGGEVLLFGPDTSTINAVVTLDPLHVSPVTTEIYNAAPTPPPPIPPPTLSPPSGHVPLLVYIINNAEAGEIVYTTDGTNPTWTHGTHVTTPFFSFTLAAPKHTVKAIAATDATHLSAITTGNYT